MTKLLLSLLLLAVATPAAAGRADDALWLDWNDGLAQAASRDRPVLVNVYTDWCGWCRRMDRDVLARDDVRDYLSKHFVTVKLNAEAAEKTPYQGRDYTARSLASGFRVTGYPTTIFLRPDGSHLVNVPGYVGPERFLVLLRYVGEGHLERGVNFQEFEKGVTPGKAQ